MWPTIDRATDLLATTHTVTLFLALRYTDIFIADLHAELLFLHPQYIFYLLDKKASHDYLENALNIKRLFAVSICEAC